MRSFEIPQTEKVAILGLGYVGLPLALALAKEHIVVGFDVSDEAVERVSKEHMDSTVQFTTDPTLMKDSTTFIICVPTPLRDDDRPDLSYVKSATLTIQGLLKRGDMVILESTTYPGTTRDVLAPILEKTNLKVNEDFHLVFSPERIDPGNPDFEVENITKLVGGMDAVSTKRAVKLYDEIIATVIPVDTPEIAEAAKIMENIFRNVNIALVNEMALIFERMGIDVWKVIDGAASKPFGYMPFYPGPGVGGHCIPLDPHYLSYQAHKYGISPRFIQLSADINKFMPVHTLNLARQGLSKLGKDVKDSKICVMGLSYKAGISDTREAPSYALIEELVHEGASVTVYDPYVEKVKMNQEVFSSLGSLGDALTNVDCVIFMVDHKEFKEIDWKNTPTSENLVVVDTRNIFPDGVEGKVYVGLGKSFN